MLYLVDLHVLTQRTKSHYVYMYIFRKCSKLKTSDDDDGRDDDDVSDDDNDDDVLTL